MKTPAGLDERCRQDPWSQANQGGPTKNQHHENLFVAWMFRQWGHGDVDHVLESSAEPGIEMERVSVCRMAR